MVRNRPVSYTHLNDQGVLAMANLNKTNYNIENLLNLNIDLAKGIHLGATAGVTYDGHKFLRSNEPQGAQV